MNTIGSRIKEERVKLGLSQNAFAELGDMKKLSQVKYESGERTPDANYLSKIAEHGVDANYIITGQRLDSDTPAATNPNYAGSTEEKSSYVISIINSAMYKLHLNDCEDVFKPTRQRVLVDAALNYQMDEREMIWFIKSALVFATGRVPTQRSDNPENKDDIKNALDELKESGPGSFF